MLTFTSITVFEIVFGLAFKGASSQLARVSAWMERNEEVTPVAADCWNAAHVNATAARQGSIVELPDCLIASVAARLGRPLVTGNTEHFLAIQRTGVIPLVIENWREAKV